MNTHGVALTDLRQGILTDDDDEGPTLGRKQLNRSSLPPQATKAFFRQRTRRRIRSSCVARHSPPLVDDPRKNSVNQEADAIAPQKNGHIQKQTEASLQERPLLIGHISRGIPEWPRLSISLSRKEKEDDFMVMKGSRLPPRPKKRAKHVENFISYISPGTFYCDLTRDRYEIKGEKQYLKKKIAGLRAMQVMDGDSE